MPIRFASCAPESDHAAPFRFADAWQAYIACRRGKRRTASAQRYAVGVFDRLANTVDALASGMWKPSTAQAFVVTRPKAREVLAAAFGDRVVHHLLVPHLERQFEPAFIFDAWSNRVGKGIHAAVARLRGFMQSLTDNGARPGHALQLDIANFFNRIDRARLFQLLRRRLERDVLRKPDDVRHIRSAMADRLLWLCRQLLTGNAALGARPLGDPQRFASLPAHKRLINAPAGHGLPIGNLTSQFFANVYLNELDQFVKHRLKCRHYLRYVDDFVLLATDRQTLEHWREDIQGLLRRRLDLELRDEGLIAPVADGVDFLGYRVRASHLVCRPRVAGHCRQALVKWQRRWIRETPKATIYDLSQTARDTLASSVASYAAHFRHACHERLWAGLRRRHPALRTLFEAPRNGSCRPTWTPPREANLAGQWRYFHAQCSQWFPLPAGWRSQPFRPWLLLLQVGREVEAYGDDVRRLADAWTKHSGRAVWRRGLGEGLAWPRKRLPSLFGIAARLGWHVAWVAEEGYRRRAGKRRVLRRLVIAEPNRQKEFAFIEKGRLS